jgi:hypothetical protein
LRKTHSPTLERRTRKTTAAAGRRRHPPAAVSEAGSDASGAGGAEIRLSRILGQSRGESQLRRRPEASREIDSKARSISPHSEHPAE